jgi:hypothetical protein
MKEYGLSGTCGEHGGELRNIWSLIGKYQEEKQVPAEYVAGNITTTSG